MAKVEGVQKVLATLGEKARDAALANVSVLVGYTQSYGYWVHENLEAVHPHGQAKFLEQPAREKGAEIGAAIRKAKEGGASMEQALIMGGLLLQRESQLLCPVLTGALKGSAFTRVEGKE